MALQSQLNLNSPQAIANTGKRIYDQQYKAEYEQKYLHQFVAVDVLGGSATLGQTSTEALIKAQALHPEGFFHLIRVGHVTALEVGFGHRWSNHNVTSDRLS